MFLTLVTITLADQSKIYDVELDCSEEMMTFHCMDLESANRFISELTSALTVNTRHGVIRQRDVVG